MKGDEKKIIYNLLKTAESWAYSYTAPEFSGSEPMFEDDVVEKTAVVQKTADNTDSIDKTSASSDSMGTDSVGTVAKNAPMGTENMGTVVKSAAMGTDSMGTDEKKSTIAAGSNSADSSRKSSIDSLCEKIKVCHNCVLSKTRKNTVPGEGVLNPVVMVIGEGPGEDEDNTGRPFVGKAGQLLDKMLSAIELSRNVNCYICNIVKCRPPMNRTPMPDEASACQGFLEAQIHTLKPVMILAMGRTAVQHLMQTTEGINALRGKMLEYRMGSNPSTPAIPLMATYHPSALLRDPALKRPAWEDLKVFKTKLNELAPGYEENYKASLAAKA